MGTELPARGVKAKNKSSDAAKSGPCIWKLIILFYLFFCGINQRTSVSHPRPWWISSLKIRSGQRPGDAGSPGCSSPRRRCTSWSVASSSKGTCPPLRETTWPACSNSPQPRWKSGSRTGGTSANVSGRTRAWRWCLCRRPGGCPCRSWCGTESLVWRPTQAPTTRPTAWATSTTSPTTTTRPSATTPAPAATQTMRVIIPQRPPSNPCKHPPTAAITWILEIWIMSRTHLAPLMESPLYTALGRGRENVISPVQYFVVFFNRMCWDLEV